MLIWNTCESSAPSEESLPTSLVSLVNRSGPPHPPAHSRPYQKQMKVKIVFTQQQNYLLVLGVVNLVKKKMSAVTFLLQKISVFLAGSQALEPTEGLTNLRTQ